MRLPASTKRKSSLSNSSHNMSSSNGPRQQRMGLFANAPPAGGEQVQLNDTVERPERPRMLQRRSVSLNELSSTASAVAAAAASFQNQDWLMQDPTKPERQPTSSASSHKRPIPQEVSSMAQAKRILTAPQQHETAKRPAVRRTGSMDLVSLNNSNRSSLFSLPTTFSRNSSMGSATGSRKNSLITSSGAAISNTLLPSGVVPAGVTPGQIPAAVGRYTESVPLSIPSTFQTSKSIYSGIHNITHQALQTMTLYIQKCYPNHSLSTRDISIGPDAWKLVPQHGTTVAQIPKSLRRLGINFLYQRDAVFLFNPGGGGEQVTVDVGLPSTEKWYEKAQVLGRFVLKYGCAKMIHGGGGAVAARAAAENFYQTQQQQAQAQAQHSEDVERSLVLYQYDVEYRTPAPTSESINSTPSNATREMQMLLKTKQKSAGTWRKMESEMEELALLQFSPTTSQEVFYDANRQQPIDLSLIQQAALSALRNPNGQFKCDFLSSQTGKKYRFDFMDGSISNGYVPRYEMYPKLPGQQQQQQRQLSQSDLTEDEDHDPTRESKKVLCLTVTDNAHPASTPPGSQRDLMAKTDMDSALKDISTISLTLDGPLRNPLSPSFFTSINNSSSSLGGSLHSASGSGGGPSGGSYQGFLSSHFRSLRAAPTSVDSPSSPMHIANSVSGQILLLHPCERGRVYVDGVYVTTLDGDSISRGNQTVSSNDDALPLFGFDLKGISILRGAAAGAIPTNANEEGEQFEEEGRILNKEELMYAYSRLLQEVLIDASQLQKNVAGRLYNRLNINEDVDHEEEKLKVKETTEVKMENDDENEAMDDSEGVGTKKSEGLSQQRLQLQKRLRTCIESEIMSDSRYDPVGIAARALATHFSKTYGKDAYPCLEGDEYELKKRLVGRRPIVVSERLLQVLRRGSYFEVAKMDAYEWFSCDAGGCRTQSRDMVAQDGENGKKKIIFDEATRMLTEVGCPAKDVALENIVVLKQDRDQQAGVPSYRSMCRYNEKEGKFYVNDLIFSMPTSALNELVSSAGGETDASVTNGGQDKEDLMTRAFLLGFFIAQEHQDGSILLKYILKNGGRR